MRHAFLYGDDGPAFNGVAPGHEAPGEHLPSLRPLGKPLFENADGRYFWTREFLK